MFRSAFFAVVLCAAFATSCRSGRNTPTGRTATGFPSRASLDALARTTVDVGDTVRIADVERWTFGGPFPQSYVFAPFDDGQPWTAALKTLSADTQGRVRPSVALYCVAREIARFYLANDKKTPSLVMQRHLAARCKATMTSFGTRWLVGTVPTSISDAELFAQWKNQLPQIFQVPDGVNVSTGLALMRDGDQAVFMFVWGRRDAHLTKLERRGNTYVIEGRLLERATSLRTLANRGPFGVAECAEDITTKLPAFRFECQIDPNDSAPWIEVAYFPPGRIFGSAAAQVQVRPNGTVPREYTRPSRGETNAVRSRRDVEVGLFAMINGVRKDAGMVPLTQEVQQSRVAETVAKHYFAARIGVLDLEVAEVVALGMRAGWNVADTVRYGSFTAAASFGTPDLGMLVAMMVEGPFGREVLLDPQVRRISIGAMYDPRQAFFGAIVSTYALFEKPNAQLRKEVLANLTKLRRSASRGPATTIPGAEAAVATVEAAIFSGELDLEGGMRMLLDDVSKVRPVALRAWVVESSDLASIEWPNEIALMPRLEVALAVTWYQPESEPWGRYVVVVVFEPAAKTASL